MIGEPPSNPSWQRFKDLVELSSKIATVVLTGVVGYATYAYNRQQDEARQAREREQAALQQVQTIIGLFEPLSSSDPQKKRLAVLTVKELTTNVPLALKLCMAAASPKECADTASSFDVDTLIRLSGDAGKDAPAPDRAVQKTARAALDVRQAAPAMDVEPARLTASDVPRPRPGEADAAPLAKAGWVFLGTYSEGKWLTRYLTFDPRAMPDSLAGQTVEVRTPLNVRGNLFYEPGYDRVLDVLAPGSKVTLDKISSYAGGGYYIWAQARYAPK